MKDPILPLPQLKMAAFIITLAVLGVFSFTSFTEAETPDIGPYAALDSLLEAPEAAANCPFEICTSGLDNPDWCLERAGAGLSLPFLYARIWEY